MFGRSYTQTSLEIEGIPEGVRVMIYGSLETAPKAVNTKLGSPLQFFLLEYDPANPQEPIRHDVWARNKVREALQSLKLKKGTAWKQSCIVIPGKWNFKAEQKKRTRAIIWQRLPESSG